MLFPDITCTVQNSLQKNMQYGVYELAEVDYVRVVTVYKKTKQLEFNGELQLNEVNKTIVDHFLERNIDLFLEKKILSNIFFEGYYFHMTSWKEAKPFIAFVLLCRRFEPFQHKNLQWIDIYTDLNNQRIVLENTISEEQEYLTNIINSSGAGIMVLSANKEVRSTNAIAEKMFCIDEDHHLIFRNESAETEFNEAFHQVLESGRRQLLKSAYLDDKENQRMLTSVISTLRSKKNRVVGVVIVTTDITENQMLAYEVEQLRQYGLVGEISLGLVHDIKNPLTSIQGCAYLLGKSAIDDKNKVQLTNIIQHEVGRINDTITQLLAYGDISAMQHEMCVDINSILKNCINIIERQKSRKSIKIIFRLSDRLPEVVAKAVHIQQLFLNLMLNAVQAIDKNGEIIIDTWYDEQKDTIHVRICDTGAGMSAEVLERAFALYFTTKKVGTGLGLFVVKRILDTYRGEIIVESESGCGTTCTISLPV